MKKSLWMLLVACLAASSGCATNSLGQSGWGYSMSAVRAPYNGRKIPLTVRLWRPVENAGAMYESTECAFVRDMVRFQPGVWNSTQNLLEAAFANTLPSGQAHGGDLVATVAPLPSWTDAQSFTLSLWDADEQKIVFQTSGQANISDKPSCAITLGRALRLTHYWEREFSKILNAWAADLKNQEPQIAGYVASKAKLKADEAAGDQALNGGNAAEAFARYLAALQNPAIQGAKSYDRLLDKLLPLISKASPPAVPEDAQRLAVIARTKFKDAQDPNGFNAAAAAYDQALKTAPWWATLYFDQAVAWEKAGHYKNAIASYQRYLKAAPDAKDAEDVKKRAWALEAKIK